MARVPHSRGKRIRTSRDSGIVHGRPLGTAEFIGALEKKMLRRLETAEGRAPGQARHRFATERIDLRRLAARQIMLIHRLGYFSSVPGFSCPGVFRCRRWVEPSSSNSQAVIVVFGIGHVRTMEQVRSAAVAMRPFNMTFSASSAPLALVLAAIGIYGVIAYSVTQRTHEIGWLHTGRETRTAVLRLVLRQGFGSDWFWCWTGHCRGAHAPARTAGELLISGATNRPYCVQFNGSAFWAVAMLASLHSQHGGRQVDPLIALRRRVNWIPIG